MTKWLTLEHVRDICFVYAQTRLAFDEPIPPFNTRFPGKLETILEIPKQEFEGQLFYPTLTEQAAVLFYSLVKELNGLIKKFLTEAKGTLYFPHATTSL